MTTRRVRRARHAVLSHMRTPGEQVVESRGEFVGKVLVEEEFHAALLV